jgi:hypothetical protein
MAIDWKKFETVFRLLAAVHAALGEDAVSPEIFIFRTCQLCHDTLYQIFKLEKEYELGLAVRQNPVDLGMLHGTQPENPRCGILFREFIIQLEDAC